MSGVTILETERLRLSTWTETGFDEVYALHADQAVNTYLFSYGDDWTREKAEGRVTMWLNEFDTVGLGKHRVSLKSTGEFVGRAGFTPQEGQAPEISYSLAKPHWGQGYAHEIASALSQWLFRAHAYDHFIGFAHIDNAGSRRILEKIGMTPTHEGDVEGLPHQFYRKDRPAQ